MSESSPARAIRVASAIFAGEAAARLRKLDMTSTGEGNPSDHGAYQWAAACGFADDPSLRSAFTHSFLATLRT